jgi:HSP20 family protein
MTLYINSYPNRTRRMLERMMNNDWVRPELGFSFPVDVKVEDDAYIITALLPGVTVEDLNIQVANETISLQGEAKVERNEGDNYLLQERPSGKFSRTLTLPEPLDSAKADASLVNGVLTLRIPKAEEARPKTIKINNN